jgi:hypothetical protein
MLATKPQPPLTDFDRQAGKATTPFKYADPTGTVGWKETGLWATGVGIPVRPPQKSTDGFWTIDVALVALSIDGHKVSKVQNDKEGYYIRLEIKPGTAAHSLLEREGFSFRETIGFEGPVRIDHGRTGIGRGGCWRWPSCSRCVR